MCENYRPNTLLVIESKMFENCLYIALKNHFCCLLTNHQLVFAKKLVGHSHYAILPEKDKWSLWRGSRLLDCRDLHSLLWGIRQRTSLRVFEEFFRHRSRRLFTGDPVRLPKKKETKCTRRQHNITNTNFDKWCTIWMFLGPASLLHLYYSLTGGPHFLRCTVFYWWSKNASNRKRIMGGSKRPKCNPKMSG